MIASVIVGLLGITVAWRLHYVGRTSAAVAPRADAPRGQARADPQVGAEQVVCG